MGVLVIGAAYVGWQIGAYAGKLYNNWKKQNNPVNDKHRVNPYKNPNGRFYASYPSYSGNKGNRAKSISPSSVTYSFGNGRYYVKGHGYLSKSSLNRLGISSAKLAEIAYEESYNYYLSTKDKERAKLQDPDLGDFFDSQDYLKTIRRGGSNSPPIISSGGKIPLPRAIILFLSISGISITYDVFSKISDLNSFHQNCIKYLEFKSSNNDTRMTSVFILK